MTTPDLAAETRDGVDGLLDTDTGRYELRTHTARYLLLDLDARRLQRVPRTAVVGTEDHPIPPGTVVFGFDFDGSWVDLVELVHCVRGDEMRLLALIDGQTQPWRTTAVLLIKRVATGECPTTKIRGGAVPKIRGARRPGAAAPGVPRAGWHYVHIDVRNIVRVSGREGVR